MITSYVWIPPLALFFWYLQANEVTSAGIWEDFVVARPQLVWVGLVLTPLTILAYVWAARQRRRTLARLGNPALVTKLAASVHAGNRLLQAILTVLGVVCLCLALLRFQYGGVARIVPAAGLDIVLVVDYSKSMLATDIYPSRSRRLEAELQRFLDEARKRGDRVGLVVFAGAARGLPVSRDMRLLKLYLAKANPLHENPGGTAIGKALKLAVDFLVEARSKSGMEGKEAVEGSNTTDADQVIILMTDGEDTSSRPLEVAREAARLGIRIFTVGIGSKSGEPIQKFDEEGNPSGYQTDDKGNYLMTRVDEELLKNLAQTSEGKYVHLEADRFGLDEVSRWLADLTRAQREETVTIERVEAFSFLVFPAFVLLTMSLLLSERRKKQ